MLKVKVLEKMGLSGRPIFSRSNLEKYPVELSFLNAEEKGRFISKSVSSSKPGSIYQLSFQLSVNPSNRKPYEFYSSPMRFPEDPQAAFISGYRKH